MQIVLTSDEIRSALIEAADKKTNHMFALNDDTCSWIEDDGESIEHDGLKFFVDCQ